ncbi:unnamed protein product [Eruca vesicaria subsp. sativa]|uniref:SMP domain-containing protein n=1 Tax=Eruca vesicaria subsp. sativa TaxID=29727 RepID=A0ABC8LYC1_ERUVS|nr:unnamed protein product [Eruca vesicaria subsp. sativa]
MVSPSDFKQRASKACGALLYTFSPFFFKDATKKLPGDKVVTSEDAEAVVGAELKNSPEMKTTHGGVADSMSAGARLNQPL